MFEFTDRYLSDSQNLEYTKQTMMGPNAMRVSEEMAAYLDIQPDSRVLDLGCGMGLSTILLVQKYQALVFAADLWISPTDNYQRFCAAGIDEKAIPVAVDATQGLPFAEAYFDCLFTVDAYHYFADIPEMLPSLIPYVKKGGYIAIAIPGLKFDFDDQVPEDMQPFWNDEIDRTIRSIDWWKDLWNQAEGIETQSISEMVCCKQAWDEWLTGYIPEAAEDIPMMQAEQGKYFNFIQMIAKVL